VVGGRGQGNGKGKMVNGKGKNELIPTSEVETADDADDADKQEPGGETSRMSPKNAP